jgi:hypothetical protein
MAIQVVLPESGHATKRRWPRHKIDVPVQFVTHGPANVVIIRGRGSELNCGGMSVFGRVELAIGTQVGVKFTPPFSGRPVSVRCFVRNRQCYNYGLEFVTENDSDYENVAQIESTLRTLGIANRTES